MKNPIGIDKNIRYTPTTMSVNQRTEKVTEEGEEKEAFVVSFTNGAKQQLEELQAHFKTNDLLDVVKLGISFLQRVKEINEKKKAEAEKNEPE